MIVQADDLETDLPQIIIAMISSRMSRAGHPSRVMIRRATQLGDRSGLLQGSEIITDNLATVTRTPIGYLTALASEQRLETLLSLQQPCLPQCRSVGKPTEFPTLPVDQVGEGR